MFTKAIVRKPGSSMIAGITTSNLGIPNYALALQQHTRYVQALEACGLAVQELPANEAFPDATFIEDVAVCTPHGAVITRPGALSRRGETEGMAKTLESYFERIESIRRPGTLEGGDVMMVGDHYYIGISERTNRAGADQLIDILEQYGMAGSKIPLRDFLHLKSGVAYLENRNLLVSGEFIDHPEFDTFRKIMVPENEILAANAIWVNGKVLLPRGNPMTQALLEAAGYELNVLDITEFEKLDGGLSCLSLRF